MLVFIIFEVSAQSNSNENITQTVEKWIQENPNASGDMLLDFLEYHLPKIETIQETYWILAKIINSFPSDAIPYTVYVYFANISALTFDFHNASLMYYSAYTMTQDSQYLLQVAIQEFEIGNVEAVYEYLYEIIQKSSTSNAVLLSAYILQSEALLILEGAELALSFIINAQYTIQKSKVSPEFLFQSYKLAKLADNQALAETTKSILIAQFPNAIVTQRIVNPQIQSLPLPSLLFTGTFLPDSLFQYDDTNNNSTTANSSPNFAFSPAPESGYQVAAFTNMQNARNSLEYYQALWSSNKVNLQNPIVVKKDIDSTSYFQIIFPLDSDTKIKEAQQMILKEMGIEGFFVTNKSVE